MCSHFRNDVTDPLISMLKTQCCWKMMTVLVQREAQKFVFSRNCLPILGQLWSFAVFHSYEHPCFEQSLRINRIAGVSSSNCTVTNRSRSWTKTCAYSFVCTSPFAVTTVVKGLLDLRKVSISSERKSFLLSMCIEAPESTTNIRSSVFLETSTGAFYFHK